MYIFLDESGNFKANQEDYFIVGGFITGEPKRTAKAFRKWQYKKFPPKLQYKTEVKFSDSGLNEKLRYFSTLKNSIIASKELFDDYWTNLYKNKKSASRS